MLRFFNFPKRSLSALVFDKNADSVIGNRTLGRFIRQPHENPKKAILTQRPVVDSHRFVLPFQFGGDIFANFLLAASAKIPAKSANLKPMSLTVELTSLSDYCRSRAYHVKILRESPRFVFSTINLRQSGKKVAVGNVNFHANEASLDSLDCLPTFPEQDCPNVKELTDDNILMENIERNHNLSASELNYIKSGVIFRHGMGFEIRPCNPEDYFRLNKEPTNKLAFWMRYREKEIGKVFNDFSSSAWSEALLAFASDFRILSPAIRQSPSFRFGGQMHAIWHAMWFFPTNQLKSPKDWFLYETRLGFSHNNTAMCEGNLWSEDKQLLAVVKQFAVVRPPSTSNRKDPEIFRAGV